MEAAKSERTPIGWDREPRESADDADDRRWEGAGGELGHRSTRMGRSRGRDRERRSLIAISVFIRLDRRSLLARLFPVLVPNFIGVHLRMILPILSSMIFSPASSAEDIAIPS